MGKFILKHGFWFDDDFNQLPGNNWAEVEPIYYQEFEEVKNKRIKDWMADDEVLRIFEKDDELVMEYSNQCTYAITYYKFHEGDEYPVLSTDFKMPDTSTWKKLK